jgi:transcriptional regulator with XRE-family HTH domain
LSLAALLTKRRKSLGYTQTELADLIGSSQSRVAKMEAGDPSVSIDLLIRALLALGANHSAAQLLNCAERLICLLSPT